MRSDDEQLMLRLALHMIPGIGPVLARNLISYCGSVEDIFRKRKNQLEKIPGIGKERAELIVRNKLFEKAKEEMKWIRRHNIRPLFYLDPGYPTRLRQCEDAPLMIFFNGEAELNSNRIVAVVGTRHVTTYGKEATERLIKDLAAFQPLIVSGLAFGVDIAAHKAALKAGLATIAVVAHGLDKIYPSDHSPIAAKMISHGGIISEYVHGVRADKENFPARNRIVAGLSDAVIVIESARKGGALITADIANSYNRDVFALPGRTTDSFSTGCHDLIRQNKAMIFENAAHIAEVMNWNQSPGKQEQSKQLILFKELNDDEKIIVALLRIEKQSSVDQLAIDSAMQVSKVSSLLLGLEFAGVLKSLPGKMYELC